MVRVSDISKFLAVTKSSVIEALGVLASKRLLIHERYGKIHFTQKGFKIARDVQKNISF